MSFIGAGHQGQGYAPGWFLVNNEDCSRFTKTIPQSLATTAADGTKYVKMGTAFPSNDANAIGIIYEDVDVTSGSMPGSVVTKGEVYEDRLAVTGASYDAVTPVTGDNPAEKGWYERSGSAGAYVYTLTDDTTVADGVTYYAKSDVRLASAAKTALAALGFKFVATSPAVTRPY